MTNEPLHGKLGRLILQTLPAGPLHIKSDTPRGADGLMSNERSLTRTSLAAETAETDAT